MNITESIAKQIGGEIENLINNTPEIQIYENSNINSYQWRDSRFEETEDVWKNRKNDAKTEEELIEILKRHLDLHKD